MLTAPEESELRAILSLTRGCERSYGQAQTAKLFSALADRLDNFLEQHGEAAWRRRIGQLPIAAEQQGASNDKESSLGRTQ
jgi:hypothetical protein